MVQDYDGDTVIDATGEEIGTVEQSYVDDAGHVCVVKVKLGRLFAKHRLVPVDDVEPHDGRLRVRYRKQTIEDAPDVDAKDDVVGETLARVRAYYAGGREPVQQDRLRVQEREATVRDVGGTEGRDVTAVPADDTEEMRRVRDLGDVIEVPIVEEELVKRPVVKEVLRVRKDTVTDRQQVNEELRKEDVDIERTGDVDIRVDEHRRS